MSILTPLHLTLIKDIVRMSLSEYAEVHFVWMSEVVKVCHTLCL